MPKRSNSRLNGMLSSNSVSRIFVGLLLFAACAGMALAARFVEEGGRWPATWPDEMEPLRERATTYEFSSGTQEQSYVIPFTDREEFERLWPTLLSVAEPGAPISLVSGPMKYWDSETTVKAGVRIYQGQTSVEISTTKDGRQQIFKLEKPWPKHFFGDDGTLTPYALFDFDSQQWVPRTPEGKAGIGYRIRTEIMLIVDDDVVELSRIKLPENATIHDNRDAVSDEFDRPQVSSDEDE